MMSDERIFKSKKVKDFMQTHCIEAQYRCSFLKTCWQKAANDKHKEMLEKWENESEEERCEFADLEVKIEEEINSISSVDCVCTRPLMDLSGYRHLFPLKGPSKERPRAGLTKELIAKHYTEKPFLSLQEILAREEKDREKQHDDGTVGDDGDTLLPDKATSKLSGWAVTPTIKKGNAMPPPAVLSAAKVVASIRCNNCGKPRQVCTANF